MMVSSTDKARARTVAQQAIERVTALLSTWGPRGGEIDVTEAYAVVGMLDDAVRGFAAAGDKEAFRRWHRIARDVRGMLDTYCSTEAPS